MPGIRRVDLHTHSTASDGTFSPAAVVQMAADRGVTAIALTDHDCVDGVQEAVAAGHRLGVEVVPGIEMSAEYEPGTMHIVGLFVDPGAPSLKAKMERMQVARADRNPRIAEKLRDIGLDITYEEIVAASGGGQVGRPHFAKVLIEKGYVRNMQDAFDRYLKKGAPAYCSRFRFSPEESIELIHEAGGVAVLAHPFTLGLDKTEQLRREITSLSEKGLDAVEVAYSAHSVADEARLRILVEELGLLESGGSDFHGTHKPGIEIGVGRGQLCIPPEVLESLRSRRPRPGP